MTFPTVKNVKVAGNRRSAQWPVRVLFEHSTSHQLLCYLDSFELRNPHRRKAAKRYHPFEKNILI
ncbi:hypothetical protein FJ651_09035 [Paucihalobacter ruber]|uniref:Uncharacterized protein n=1 Tax=Paucihalobacter ruber TaxID=2567861 RepID=A0A506PLT3_9FLAO|nr:hypothetical protein [Paucihalobacter ruber]TPV33230.1 hypothetical protein FJ651_09035 [Paucihalobacter ruber]